MKKEKVSLVGDDCREGLTAIVSVKVPDPKFSSQTKDRLVSSEVRPIVEGAGQRGALDLARGEPWRGEEGRREGGACRPGSRGGPQGARRHPQGRARRRLPARQARRLPGEGPGEDRSSSWSRAIRPAARQSRAATAPSRPCCRLRGKILNVERVQPGRMLSSEQIGTLITALGVGIEIGGQKDDDTRRAG